jgi:hypothetical protein
MYLIIDILATTKSYRSAMNINSIMFVDCDFKTYRHRLSGVDFSSPSNKKEFDYKFVVYDTDIDNYYTVDSLEDYNSEEILNLYDSCGYPRIVTVSPYFWVFYNMADKVKKPRKQPKYGNILETRGNAVAFDNKTLYISSPEYHPDDTSGEYLFWVDSMGRIIDIIHLYLINICPYYDLIQKYNIRDCYFNNYKFDIKPEVMKFLTKYRIMVG